jgi:antitoxin VapB
MNRMSLNAELTPNITAAVFMSGNSQAVRLPKAFQVKSKRVTIERRGAEIVLREHTEAPRNMKEFLDLLPVIPDWPDAEPDGPEEPVKAW